jgi:outer membrane protein assembly factor BamB/tetratricopeptide (TPR) repeat protein
MSPFRPRVAAGLALFGAVLAVTLTADAQPRVAVTGTVPGGKKGKEKDDRDWNEAIFLPVEREAKNKIDAVNKYLTGKEQITPKLWEDIISVLQGLLDDPADKFVEIDGKGNKVSVKKEVNRIIGTFDDDGRQFYQRLVGPTADQKYKQAEDENDMLLMAEVSTRYLHTKAGAAATIRIGTWHLDRGRYAQAANAFRLFLLRNPKDKLDAPLLFKAALAYKRQAASDPTFAKEAQRYWDLFEQASNKGQVGIGSKSFTYEQLKAEYDKAVAVGHKTFHSEWGLFRKDPSNNGVGQGGTPFLEPKFTYPYSNPTDDFRYEEKKAGFEILKDRTDKALKLMDQKGLAPIPGVFPVASAGKVVFRGLDGVYCIATREDKSADPPIKPGELLWKTEVEQTNSPTGLWQMAKDLGSRSMFDQFLAQYTASGPHSILIENPLIGSLSHDGTNVYFVDDIAVPPHPAQWQQAMFNGMPVSFGVFNDAASFSRLKAVNLETGKLVWKIGDRTQGGPPGGFAGGPGFGGPVAIDPRTGQPVPPKEEAPKAPVKETTETLLSDCFFLGPPLPLAGKLYVAIEKDGDLRLVCLDPTKMEKTTRDPQHPQEIPSLVWSQVLGQPNGRLPQDSFRRYQCIHLAYADGILVVPTNAGAVLGIDLFSHSLVWAANYKSNKTARPMMDENMMPGGGRFRGGIQPNMGGGALAYETSRERWHAGCPIIAGSKVVYTAFDSDTIECVDLHDGRPVWKTPVPRQEGDQYVAGVFDDKVMIVGKGYVRFHSLANGAQIKDAIPTGIPTGIGAATKDLYFVPIKAAKDKSNEPGIVAIDTKTMQVKGTSRSRKKEPAGNLLFYEDDVLSVTPAAVSSYPQLDTRIKDTQERLAKNYKDPQGLLDLAMLEHDDGRLVPAIDNYRKCLANKPTEDLRGKAREKLFEAITELLQNDFGAGEKMLPEYLELCKVEVPADATEAQKKLLGEEELRRHSNYYCLVAKGKETQGKLLDAFDNYMKFGTLVGNKEMVSVIDEPNTNARPDVWARGRIQNMIRKATPAQKRPLENRVVEEWKKVKDTDDLEKLRGFVKVFGGMFEAGTDAKIALADKLAASGSEDDAREAEYMLLAVRDGEDELSSAKATEALARLYIRKGLLDDAVGMYAELGKQHAKTVVRDGKTGSEFFNDLITDKRFLPYLEPPTTTWTYTKLKGSETTSGGGYSGRGTGMDIEMPADVLPFFKRHRLVVDMNNRSGQGSAIKVIDRVTGEDKYTSPGFGFLQWQQTFQQQNIPYKFVQVKGHVAVVTAHGSHPQTGLPIAKVYAFDVADKKKLWELDMFGTNPNMAVLQQQQVNQQMEADGLRLTYADGWSTKVGQTWVVEATYTVVLTKDGLVAKDNARGTVLWTKSNVSPRTNMIGDGEFVFLYDTNPDGAVSPVRCYRAADGVEVTVPDSSAAFTNVKRAKFYGRKVLAFDDEPGKKAVRLYDLFTGKDLWKRDLGADGWMLRSEDDDYTGFVTTGGDVIVLNAADGKELFKGKLDPKAMGKHLEKVHEAMLFADPQRFFVVLNRPHDGANARGGFQPVFTQAIRSVRVNGTMYAFDRTNSKRLWYTDEQLDDQNISLEQFSDLPIIIAASQYQKFAANGNFEGQFMHFVALDKATGKLKFAKQGVSQGQYHSIVTDPRAGTIEVFNYSNHRIKFVPDDGKTVGSTDGAGGAAAPTTPAVPAAAVGAVQIRVAVPAVAVPPPPPVPPKK